MYIPKNAFELFDEYRKYYQKDGISIGHIGKMQGALLHCVAPALGGPKPMAKPKGKRLTKDEIQVLMGFLISISVEEFLSAPERVTAFMNEQNIARTKKQEYWTYFKKLLKWATEQPYVINNRSTIINDSPQDSNLYVKETIQAKGKNLNMFGKQARVKYSVGCHSGDYITFALRSQLEDYRKFLVEDRGLCDDVKSTVNANLTIVNLLLGWLHREKNVPLDNLCLETIIPLLKIKPKRAEFKDANGVLNRKAYLNAERKLTEQARESNRKTISLVKTFLDDYSKALTTRINVLSAITNVAKFIYKNDTNTKIARDFEDIEIIELLRELRRDEINNFKMLQKSKTMRLNRDSREVALTRAGW